MHNSNLICFHYFVTVDIFHVKLGLRTSVWMKHDWKMLLTIVMTKSLNFSSCWLSFLSHTTSKVKKCTLRMCVLSFIQLTRFFLCLFKLQTGMHTRKTCSPWKMKSLTKLRQSKCYCFERNYVETDHATSYTNILILFRL